MEDGDHDVVEPVVEPNSPPRVDPPGEKFTMNGRMERGEPPRTVLRPLF